MCVCVCVMASYVRTSRRRTGAGFDPAVRACAHGDTAGDSEGGQVDMLELIADARPRGSQLGFGILSRMLPAAPRSSGLLSSPPRLRAEHAVHLRISVTSSDICRSAFFFWRIPKGTYAWCPHISLKYAGVVECALASLPPASSSLTHARRMDGFCNQNADQLGYLAGLSLLTVYVGVVECAPASPYTYSSTHRFPEERTPIEATPLSATSAELGLGLGQGLGLDSLSHSSSHALRFFSPPSFHTLAVSPAFTSVWESA
jgi:hypothetical protein